MNNAAVTTRLGESRSIFPQRRLHVVNDLFKVMANKSRNRRMFVATLKDLTWCYIKWSQDFFRNLTLWKHAPPRILALNATVRTVFLRFGSAICRHVSRRKKCIEVISFDANFHNRRLGVFRLYEDFPKNCENTASWIMKCSHPFGIKIPTLLGYYRILPSTVQAPCFFSYCRI